MAAFLSVVLLAASVATADNSGQEGEEHSSYWVSGPESYLILSGDIEVHYRIPLTAPVLRVQLVEMVRGEERPLVKMDVPHNTTSGEILFPCGLVDRAGQIVFKLVTVDERNVLARSDTLDVQWPMLTVHVPLYVETLSSEVTVHMYLGSLFCIPRPRGGYATFVELMYEGSMLSNNTEGGTSTWHDPMVLETKEVLDWLLRTSYDVILNCEFFDKAGYYRVRVRTTIEDAPMVAESDTMHVTWSYLYSVSIAKTALHPCDGSLTVVYHYPRCTLDHDRIRVYGKTSSSSPAKYLAEKRVQNGRHTSKIACDIFGEEYREFCFSYVSTARNNAVFEQHTHCIPRTFDPGGAMAKWSEWTPWSPCSSPCGPGVSTRYRLCSNSTHVECDGKSVETLLCDIRTCPESTTSWTEESEFLSSDCFCGCQINVTSKLQLKITSSQCKGPVLWLFQAWPFGHLIVNIQELFLPTSDQWLTFREGESPIGVVLAVFSDTDNNIPPVHSLGTLMRLELHSSNSTLIGGVSLKATLTRTEGPMESLPIIQKITKMETTHLSSVHITMILFATLISSVTLILIIFHNLRFLKRPKKYIRSSSPCSISHDDGEHCPNQHLLAASTSTSELSGSPLVERRHCSTLPEETTPSYSPEDIMQSSFLFRSVTSLPTPSDVVVPSIATITPPTPRHIFIKTSKPILVATVSPQPKPKWERTGDLPSKRPLKSALRVKPSPLEINSGCVTKPSDSISPLRRRSKPQDRAAKQVQRESVTPLTASVSELSITGSEDGLEYDYYDYGCHDEPGSFFCPDPMLLGWPPFIPMPPQNSDDIFDYPLKHFTPSPAQSENEVHSTKS